MSERYPGGYITKNAPQPTGGESGTAPGVWTLEEAAEYQKAGTWPQPYTPKYVEDVFSTYLYTGNGTNQNIINNVAIGSLYGGSNYFDGNDDYLSFNTISISANQSFTAEAWVFVGGTYNSNQRIVFSGGGGTNTQLYYDSPADGAIGAYLNGANTVSSGGVITRYAWNHLAWCRDGSTFRLFVNGNLVASGTDGTAIAISNIGYPGTYSPNAFISSARIVRGTALYTSNFTPPTSALTAVANTQLLTCQLPNPLLDYSPNAYTITVTGEVTANYNFGPLVNSSAGFGGMVWIKDRTVGYNHLLFDTLRGGNYRINSNATDGQGSGATSYGYITGFNTNGFTVAAGTSGAQQINNNNTPYVSWTFREQAKFFDVVTYTGNGANRTISHNLGSVPGCIIVKCTSGGATDWAVYHRSIGATKAIILNGTDTEFTISSYWNNTEPTSNVFSVGTFGNVNSNGATYVAYLFAHNAGGFGLNGSDSIVSCGSYVGNGSSNGPTVTLGWEPQWILIKNVSALSAWRIFDNMRGFNVNGSADSYLIPNASDAEAQANLIEPLATGFKLNSSATQTNGSGNTLIYVAIRRGPMKVPTSGLTVFSPITSSSSVSTTLTTNFPVDAQIVHYRAGTDGVWWIDRLRGVNSPSLALSLPYLLSNNTNAESTALGTRAWNNTGFQIPSVFASASYVYWNFGRAPGFFDIVCYTGTGVARTINHNLGVAPELIIVKIRSNVSNWPVYSAPSGNTNYQYINTNSAVDTFNYWNNTSPTSTVFSVGTDNDVNASGNTYVSYLFASCPGVSKVGSYTGTGTTLQIDCGFTSGARFVMIKRTSGIGDWFVWDSARGIVAGNDPYVLMNSSDAEVTSTDYVDTYSAGFEISSTAPATINAAGATFIYLAIA